jgi:transketolase
VKRAALPEFVFITGDLGYQALEPLRDAMGRRFLNAGIAEQNMVAIAAGLARSGLRPWVYSIAPFLYARAFEQIRNDVCLTGLPVVLVGNGGGYGYGVMGATHHSLEDCACLLTLPGMRAYVPAFDTDLDSIIEAMMGSSHPAYIRLGLSEAPEWFTPAPYAPWRRIHAGAGPAIVALGPLAGGLLDRARLSPLDPDLWVISELPVVSLPDEFKESVRRSDNVTVVEEHVAPGGIGQTLAYHLVQAGIAPRQFTHRCALGYPSGLYGSQHFHRRECGIDPESVFEHLGRSC